MRAYTALAGVFFTAVFLFQDVAAAAVQPGAAEHWKRSEVERPPPNPVDKLRETTRTRYFDHMSAGILGLLIKKKKKPSRRAVQTDADVFDVAQVMSDVTAGLEKRSHGSHALIDMLKAHTISLQMQEMIQKTKNANKTEKRDAPADEQAQKTPPPPPGGVNQGDWDDCMEKMASNPVYIQGSAAESNIRIAGLAPVCKNILLNIGGAEGGTDKPTDCGEDCVEYTKMSQDYYEEINRLFN
ncbi:hypothetical protein CSOJ01_02527 [Colletotrichum sojae]|uniref:Uncharacterized protein n=1 Tax=Colletotrichum sojae TaxID=2175907 RepID=A0A8H6JQK6_9PEZI|nr:hypothetical protein CSOJ01_02527 [Colletotrichum sojae]